MLTPNHKDFEDTIAAIATPIGIGGIGVVKISGRLALKTAKSIFRKKNQAASLSLRPHHLHAGYIVNRKTQEVIDEVLLVYMPEPASYTREDVVEIQCHSGYLVLERVLGLVLSQKGVRLAEPGEFTKRAFFRGRIDLTQVEAILDVVSSRTDAALEQATAQLEGSLYERIQRFRSALITILAHIESSIDFPEEQIETFSSREMVQRLTAIHERVQDLLQTYEEGRLFREGIRAVILGRPNVGKSSLLNALLEEERAIVFHAPGTTRDSIEESITLWGIPVTIIDTAGLSTTEVRDPVEQKGAERTRFNASLAHVVMLVLDGSCALSDDDRAIFEEFHEKNMVVVVNKRDLPPVLDPSLLSPEVEKHCCVWVSAKYHQGIDHLRNVLRSLIVGHQDSDQTPPVLINRLRHKIGLEKTTESLVQAIQGLKEGVPIEFVAIDLRAALDNLGELVGETTPQEILDEIFSEFCIGK